MKRVYYGTCKSESAESEKVVIVPDLDIVDGKFNFQEGDLLTVFFAQTNTVDEPSIVVKIQETEQESSVIDDNGKFIKSLDVEAGMNGAWAAGETVIFAYTQKGNEIDNETKVYYWELVDAAHATTLLYGNTKLFDDNNLEDLLSPTTDENKYSDLALTPRALKKFWDLLTGSSKSDSDPTPTPALEPLIGLKWTPSDVVSGQEVQPLGTLSLTNDTSGVVITYPIDSSISKSIDDIASKIVTHTGQLTNNGNGNGEGHETEESEPFITRIIPENLYFSNEKGLYYGTPADNPEPTIGIVLNNNENQLAIQGGVNGIRLKSPTQINGNTSIYGALATTGAISAGSAQISTSGAIKGSVLYEGFNGTNNGIPLYQIYSKMLAFEVVSIPITVPKDPGYITNSHPAYTSNHPASAWDAIGVIGYNLSNDTNGSGASYCFLWAVALNGASNAIVYNIRATDGKKHLVKLDVRVLYRHK